MEMSMEGKMSMLTYPVLMLSMNLYLAPAMTTVDQRLVLSVYSFVKHFHNFSSFHG
jgi:hypothetical protein